MRARSFLSINYNLDDTDLKLFIQIYVCRTASLKQENLKNRPVTLLYF